MPWPALIVHHVQCEGSIGRTVPEKDILVYCGQCSVYREPTPWSPAPWFLVGVVVIHVTVHHEPPIDGKVIRYAGSGAVEGNLPQPHHCGARLAPCFEAEGQRAALPLDPGLVTYGLP